MRDASHRLPGAWLVFVAALLLIAGGLGGCSGGRSSDLNQNDSADKQNTLSAQAQVLLATDTVSSPPTHTATATSLPATDTPIPSEAIPSDTPLAAPSETPISTDTLPPAPSNIDSWDMQNFVVITNGCRFSSEDCYQGTDGDKTLVSANGLYIDPSWANPQLVFWHRYDFPENTDAYISIGVNGAWTPINYWKGDSNWKQSMIPLQEYSGETIQLQFHVPFGIYSTRQKCETLGHEKTCEDIQVIEDTEWMIQKIEIVPN